MVGIFINAVVVRCDLADNPTFSNLLNHVQTVVFGAFNHQDVPAEQVIEALVVKRSLSYAPIAQVAFSLQNLPVAKLELADLTLEQIELDSAIAKYDITLMIAEAGDS